MLLKLRAYPDTENVTSHISILKTKTNNTITQQKSTNQTSRFELSETKLLRSFPAKPETKHRLRQGITSNIPRYEKTHSHFTSISQCGSIRPAYADRVILQGKCREWSNTVNKRKDIILILGILSKPRVYIFLIKPHNTYTHAPDEELY